MNARTPTSHGAGIHQIANGRIETVKFMTRSRGASIRSKKSGGDAVGEALTGQVITLISEEGKWIEITFFDYSTGKRSGGWTLKITLSVRVVRAPRPHW